MPEMRPLFERTFEKAVASERAAFATSDPEERAKLLAEAMFLARQGQ